VSHERAVASPAAVRQRILIVEDDRFARGALQRILELDGYNVRVTGSGQRAIRVLKTFAPQVVIMDWCLPGLSGDRLCREILRRNPEVPLIVASSSDEAFSSDVEFSARLRKPIDVRQLRAVVARSLVESVRL
jgi:DNA-binding response OmpR family regulator